MSKNRTRKVLRTVLVVCEGEAEVNFINGLKQSCLPRQAGFKVKVTNAHGKGANHVIEVAIRHKKRFDYDVIAALFDTDTGWSEQVRANASDRGIVVFRSIPCFEAEILALHKINVSAQKTDEIKNAFQQKFGKNAHEMDFRQLIDEALLAKILAGKSGWFCELHQWLVGGGQ